MYDFQTIERKWQKFWEENSVHRTSENPGKKYYILEMYPYPSGDLHIGQFRNYVLGDTIARFKLIQGYDCLHPFGWDSFGLPAEGAAIKKGINPREWTMNNINTSRSTLKLMGISYDWNREIITSEPNYYKWNQWLFLKLFERGLAYREKAYVNWCSHCQTTLANEQVEDGQCWRCGSSVTKKEFAQWFFKITAYAERLLFNLDNLPRWPEQVKTLQRNWIGKSKGIEINFQYNGRKIPVFTTRPDTIYGVTFIAIAPENELAREIQDSKVQSYIQSALNRSEIERATTKDGIFTGKYAINPLSGEKVQLWIADYVLPSYGTGIIMGVPAHDERDFEFANTNGIPIKIVIQPIGAIHESPLQKAYTEPGIMINSGLFNGLPSQDGILKIEEYVKEKGLGKSQVNYRLKDWLISRQRYWGTPIPIIHCKKCGEVPVPFSELPVRLPEKVDFSGGKASPLDSVPEFINTRCPSCGNPASRDSDTMDTFVDSSWYWLRYLDPNNNDKPFSQELAKTWAPIDEYIGGIEHATGHLIYFRFISQFLHDEGLLPREEPCVKLFVHGMITDANGNVMSKSKGNAIPVSPFVKEWGADTGRITMLFIGPPEKESAWSLDGVAGVSRFLSRVYNLVESEKLKIKSEKLDRKNALYRSLNHTIKKVTQDIENFGHNTAIASLMTFVNELYKAKDDPWFGHGVRILIQLLAPFAPHLAEELWSSLGNNESVFKSKWPQWEEVEEPTVTIIVEINGKVRAKLKMQSNIEKAQVKSQALQIPNVAKRIQGKNMEKVIFVQNKLINFVLK